MMLKGGASTVLYGESEDAEKVVREAINNPLLDIDFEGATGAMIHVTGGPSLSLKRAYEVFNGITKELGDSAHIKLGARIDPNIGNSIKLMAIVTGIRTPGAIAQRVSSGGIDEVGYRTPSYGLAGALG
jgi:cell division protein FtsZ